MESELPRSKPRGHPTRDTSVWPVTPVHAFLVEEEQKQDSESTRSGGQGTDPQRPSHKSPGRRRCCRGTCLTLPVTVAGPPASAARPRSAHDGSVGTGDTKPLVLAVDTIFGTDE